MQIGSMTSMAALASVIAITALVTPRPVVPLDTLTSGLASIVRIPLGTTVADPIAAEATPGGSSDDQCFLTLYDVRCQNDLCLLLLPACSLRIKFL